MTAGLVVGAFALGAAELVAGIHESWRSPLLDVGDRVIDVVPPFVKEFAIETFGDDDKVALLAGMGVTLAVFAAVVVGLLGLRRRLRIGLAGLAAFGAIGTWAASSRRTAAPWHSVVPSLTGCLAGAVALIALHHRLAERPAAASPGSAAGGALAAGAPTVPPSSRREFLGRAGVIVSGLALAVGPLAAGGRLLTRRFTASESRQAVRLPVPSEPLPPLAAGTDLGVPGVAPFITPNSAFYRVDTALVVPQVPTDSYTLRVTGLVERELELSYDDLLARNLVERDITMTCVSNQIGGTYVGTARWLGVRLDELLEEAGVGSGADQVVGRSVDGYTCGFPLEAVRDGRDALVVVGMNGEPLPIEHGFPVRLVVPGLFGYVSATKWLTEIELTTFDAFDQYWVPRGYSAEAPIKLMSRIDTPKGLAKLAPGPVAIGGVAWAQTIGIEAVEVSIDGGEWRPAELGRVPSADTWVQWRLDWEATSGRHSLAARAIDRDGAIQTAERAEPIPDGASGHHQIVVIVE
jgi:DMSO/TMAO reductase YedYZ molybdopterin-dependent catalytic subunit